MKHNKKYYVFMVLCLLLTLIISGCSKIVNDNTIEQQEIAAIKKLAVENITNEINKELFNDINTDYLNNLETKDDSITEETKLEVIITTGNKSAVDNYLNQKQIKSLAEYIASENGQAIIASINNKIIEVKNRIADLEIEIEYKDTYTTLLNGFGAVVMKKDIPSLRLIEGIEYVTVAEKYNAPKAATQSTNGLFSSMQDSGIFKNESKYNGEGMLIAVIDTGLDYNHSAFNTMLQDVSYSKEQMEKLITEAELQGRYYNSKVAYMYDYADLDNDVYPIEEHGTHVAGIAAGDNDIVQGVAPKAQLAIMKVFSDGDGGASTLDILNALSDCAILNVDIINMSLGSGCGFYQEFGEENNVINETYNKLEKLGITICAAAGNDYYSSIVGNYKGALSTNPDASAVGSPSSYSSAFSVAAANTAPIYYIVANGEQGMMYNNAVNMKSEPYEFNEILNGKENVKLSYALVPGIGSKGDYADVDVNGKIAIISRGDISFEEKQKIAAENGAVACIIFNHEQGEINMQIENLVIPSCSVNLENGKYFISNPNGYITIGKDTYTGPDMAVYSSWGPTSSGLYIKPEITAPGTDILSTVIGEKYERMPGTSMASPNMAGLMAVVRQYLRDKFPTMSEIELYDMAHQLVMSTADTVNDKYGIPNAVRKQGAGMANLNSVLNTNAYLTVTGSNRTKIELGSDKKQTGIYTLNFNVVNFGNEAVSYELDTITLTETVIDNIIRNAAKILYDNEVEVSVRNGEYNDGIVTVAGNSTARVSVTITLTTENKNYIKSTFKNGMYVEGFVKLNNTDKNGVSLSIPWLAFFGDYDALPVFQSDIYDDELAQNYETTPVAIFRDQYLLPLGLYPYNVAEDDNQPVLSKNKISLSELNGTINNLYSIFTGLYRNVDRLEYELIDVLTKEVIWSGYATNVRKTYFNSSNGNVIPLIHELNILPLDLELANNQQVEMRMIASFTNSDNTFVYSFPMFIDTEAPELINAEYIEKNGSKILTFTMFDNRYLCDMQLYTPNPDGSVKSIYQTVNCIDFDIWGENIVYQLDITNAISRINDNTIYVLIEDYALNQSVYKLEFQFSNTEENTIEEPIDNSTSQEKEEFIISDNVLISYNGTDKTVVVPENVTTIGMCAFMENNNIEVVDLSKSKVTKLAVNAFRMCNNLKEVIMSDTLEYIGTYALADCPKLNKLILPASMKKIYDQAFLRSSNLKTIDYLGDNVFEFGWSVFLYVNEVNIFVKDSIFDKFSKIPQFTPNVIVRNLNNFETEGNVLNKYNGNDKYIVFPAAVEILGEQALKGINVESVNLNGIFEIRNEAFYGCNALKAILLDETNKIIGNDVFNNCSALNKVEIKSIVPMSFGTNVFDNTADTLEIFVPNGCLNDYSSIENLKKYIDKISEKEYFTIVDNILVDYYGKPETINIPNGVVQIGDGVFMDCLTLKNVVIPESVAVIGENAFNGCTNLSSVNIPDSILEIRTGAFTDCISLTEFRFSAKMKKISAAILNGSGVKEITIPENIMYIENNALSNMPELTKLTINSKLTKYKDAMIGYSINNISTFNPKLNEVIINGDFVNMGAMGSTSFYKCDALKTITINANVSKIGGAIFAELWNLETVILNGEIGEISDYAFANTPRLSNVEINGYVGNIGEYAFYGCSALKQFTVSDNNAFHVIDAYGILYNKEMTRIYRQPEGWDYSGTYIMPDSVTEMDSYAISSPNINAQKTLLTGIELSANLTYIPEYAFMNAVNLENISFEYVTEIDNYAFCNTALKSFTVSEQYEYLGRKVFANSDITTITITKDALKFEYSTLFAGCNNITVVNAEEGNKSVSIENGILFNADKSVIERYNYNNTLSDKEYIIPDTVIKIAANAFLNNKELTKITIPASVKAIGDKAFYGTDNLTEYHFLGTEAPLLEGMLRDTMHPYANFMDNIETLDKELTIYHPVNGAHYYNLIWSSFFTVRKEVNPDGSIVNENEANTNMQNSVALINDRKYF